MSVVLLEMVERNEQAMSERNQVSVNNATASVVKQDTPVSGRTKCKHCRGESHGADTMHARKAKCPAWDNKCTKCQVRGHNARACYQCSDCGKWGHKSKQSMWCNEGEDKQDSEHEQGSLMSAMTMRDQRKGNMSRPDPK